MKIINFWSILAFTFWLCLAVSMYINLMLAERINELEQNKPIKEILQKKEVKGFQQKVIPIMTQDNAGVVLMVGTLNELVPKVAEYAQLPEAEIRKDIERLAGQARNFTSKKPLIIIKTDNSTVEEQIAVLAHEASHVMDYTIERMGIADTSGEFRSYGIGIILETALEAKVF